MVRYRIFNPVNCPRFIFKDFTLMYKAILLQVYLRLNNLPEQKPIFVKNVIYLGEQ